MPLHPSCLLQPIKLYKTKNGSSLTIAQGQCLFLSEVNIPSTNIIVYRMIFFVLIFLFQEKKEIFIVKCSEVIVRNGIMQKELIY